MSKVSKLGPLNEMFSSDVWNVTTPNGEVVPVESRIAKPGTKKAEARKELDRAREALRCAEEKYNAASQADDASRIRMLDDFYGGKWVLEYDRAYAHGAGGSINKKTFNITKVEKVTRIGNGFVSVKGRMLRISESGKWDTMTVYTETGKDLRIAHVDQILTESQLDNTLNKVRNAFFAKLRTIW